MNTPSTYDRFEELEAGRLLGDLSEEEWSEWRELSKEHADDDDFSLEMVAAALEAEYASKEEQSLPAGLTVTLVDEARKFAADEAEPDNVVQGPFRNSPFSVGTAWAVAAAFAALFVVVFLLNPTGDGPKVVEAPPIEERADDLVTPPFEGVGPYEPMSGKVVWSDDLQEGYMELTNLEVNDPSQNQYQLWIVDPSRAKQPVDGGVFDVDSTGTVRIPINAKLDVDKPQAFVITLEKPGGVVVSEQEVVVAISKV